MWSNWRPRSTRFERERYVVVGERGAAVAFHEVADFEAGMGQIGMSK
jgi:hypothetical protein